MHTRHTGSREIFTRGAPQRRQSEGNSAANRPWATIAAPETAEFSKFRPPRPPRCALFAPWGGRGADVRVMSPVLLKTSLPRPAPGQAPAGRIALSIAGSQKPRNCSSRCGALFTGFIFPVAEAHQHRDGGSAKTIHATCWLQQEHWKDVFLQESTAPRAICVRTAAVRTLKLP